MGTGLGKTRLGVMAAATVKGKVVVVTSRTPLVEQWRAELPSAEIYVINSGAKLDTDCELLIIDEAHRATAPTFRRVFDIRYEKLLCLTATLPASEERAKVLTDIAPVVFVKTIDDVPEASAPYQVYNVPIKMLPKTAAKYRVFDSMFKEANIALARVWKQTSYPSIFEMARAESQKDGPYTFAAKKYWSGMTLRKGVLYSAYEKIGAVKEILKLYPHKK